MDQQIADAREWLTANKSGLQPGEIQFKLDALNHCVRGPFNPGSLPDRMSRASKVAGGPPKFASVKQVLTHNGGETTWESNGGIVNWMRDSVTSDCRLYRAARIFYRELQLKDLDAKTRSDEGVPIQKPASFDVEALAKEAVRQAFDGTRDDTYLTFKVLSLYGHDNMHNSLTPAIYDSAGKASPDPAQTRCEYAVLDAYKPDWNSTLYRNGAIPALKYNAADVKTGEDLAKACTTQCAALKPDDYYALRCSNLCNDLHPDYQADYYHVIAASYLSCYAESNSTRGTNVLGFVAPVTTIAKVGLDVLFNNGAYALLARKYKKDRFRGQFGELKGSDPSKVPGWLRAAYEGIDSLPAAADAGAICKNRGYSCSATEIAAAQAILNRYSFEVRFREKQHKLGQDYGNKNCSGKQAPIDHVMCSQ